MERGKGMAVQRPCGTVPLGTTNKDEVQESRLSRGGWHGALAQALPALWDYGRQAQNTMERS